MTTPSMSPEAAVVHPSRAKIVEILAKSPDGATVFGIAEAMDLHHNAVRTHLSVLARAGLVWSEREKATGRPGRPRIIFRLTDSEAAGEVASRKELLDLLLRLVARARVSRVEIEAVGVEEGRILAARGSSLVDALQRTGFAPDDITDADQAARGERHLILRHCPFAEAAAGEHGEMVCALHLGIARGLVAAQGGEVIAFEPHNPVAPACVLNTRIPVGGADGVAAPGPANGAANPGAGGMGGTGRKASSRSGKAAGGAAGGRSKSTGKA